MSTLSTTYAPAAPPPPVPGVHDASPRDERACLKSHLRDVGHIRTHPAGLRSGFRDAAKRNIVAAYAYFLVQGVLQWLSAFIFSPATAFTDPLNTFATLIVYPVINIALGILVAVLWVGSRLGGGWVIQLISDNYADGYSMANWVRASCPRLFELSADRVTTGQPRHLWPLEPRDDRRRSSSSHRTRCAPIER